MKRKFLSMALAAVLATTMLNVPVTAYADAGKATLEDMADTENPTGLINGQGTTIGEEQSIDVTSKEVGNEHKIIYSVEISWGAMNFEYNYGSAWDPATHKYTSTKTEGEWKVTGCLDGTNNRIDVTNNSNYPVTVDMSFKKEEGRFNTVTTDTSVRGVFNSDKDVLATNINGSSASACGIVGTPSIDLASADTEDKYTGRGTGHTDINSGKTSVTMYFGLWGIPDKDKAQKDGAKAGTITVSVKPYQK